MPWVPQKLFVDAAVRSRGVGLFLPDGSVIRFSTWGTPSTAATLATLLVLDNENQVTQTTVTTTGPAVGGKAQNTSPVPAGLLVSATVSPFSWTAQPGQARFDLSVLRATSIGLGPLASIAQGYIGPLSSTVFPGQPEAGPPLGAGYQGFVQSPGPSTDFTATLGHSIWRPSRINTVMITVATDATAGNRQFALKFVNASNVESICYASAVQAPSTTMSYVFSAQPALSLAAPVVTVTTIPNIALSGAWSVGLQLTNAGAADAWSSFSLQADAVPRIN